MLGETKSDRDEVADALRDKAGIKDLNGLVPLEQFDAVRGDFEKRIEASYNKFNNQELIWQVSKVIVTVPNISGQNFIRDTHLLTMYKTVYNSVITMKYKGRTYT